MKKFFTFIAVLATAFHAWGTTPADLVNTLMGTMSKHSLSTGNTYPSVSMPWGMNSWTPQTGPNGDGWTYTYTADKIRGIKQTHQPSPWINDYGQFSLMGATGGLVFDQDERASWFSHKAETASPYYYSVYLADHDVTAEIAPTERAAIVRFTFPENDSSTIIIDAFNKGSSVTIDPERRRITGWSTRNSGGTPEGFRNYFVMEFSRPMDFTAAVMDGDIRPDLLTADCNNAGAIAGFKTRRGESVSVRVASSFVSPEQAELNLRELADANLDEVKARGRQRWNEVLGRIEIEPDGDNLDQRRTFYSCLYRALLFPRALYETDADGSIIHRSPFDGKIHEGYLFTDTGFWDTFRALFPLLNLIYPSQAEKMQAGLVNTWLESGFLPEWASPGHRNCMVGNNSASVVADAWLKGLRGYDIEELWKAVKSGAHSVNPRCPSTGRLGWEMYDSLGYVACDRGINESAARTLEYAYDDWCIYRLGQALGKPESETAPYREAAFNYRNLFDPETHLMRGRKANGEWQTPFNPLKWGDAFTEGNSWHYTWSVFHDPQGLINLMGGQKEFTAMLDSVFVLPPSFDDSYYGGVIHEIREMLVMNAGNYAHGNQPIQHMVYLYDYAGQPWKTQRHAREVMDKFYSATPDGYCGDEDNGQTSAWYVFSAMGFYPVCPGSGEYALGSPLFRRITVKPEKGDPITIEAPGNIQTTPYVERLKINGADTDRNYLTHDELRRGALLEFDMSLTPSYTRGTAPEARPYSLSDENR